MRLIMVLALITSSAFAQERQGLNEIMKVLDNPSKALNEPRCEEKTDIEVNACKSLASAVCRIKNPQKKLRELQHRALTYPTVKFADQSLPTLDTIEKIEREVFETSLVKQDDLSQLFDEVKVSMKSAIERNIDLSSLQHEEMKAKIESVQFMTGAEYVKHRQKHRHEKESSSLAKMKGLRNYSDNCGNGSEVSAFNQLDKVVLCPGLIQSLMDFSPRSKREMLNSLAFTIGHELAHSIDATENRFPKVYEKMKTCYDQFETRGPEISADFWGSQIFAERLRIDNVKGDEAVRALALATDDFCSFYEDSIYPSGQARLDLTIGRDPSIRQSLGCETPSAEAPVCTLAGKIPATPPSVAKVK